MMDSRGKTTAFTNNFTCAKKTKKVSSVKAVYGTVIFIVTFERVEIRK